MGNAQRESVCKGRDLQQGQTGRYLLVLHNDLPYRRHHRAVTGQRWEVKIVGSCEFRLVISACI